MNLECKFDILVKLDTLINDEIEKPKLSFLRDPINNNNNNNNN